jgi:hypothetical protein
MNYIVNIGEIASLAAIPINHRREVSKSSFEKGRDHVAISPPQALTGTVNVEEADGNNLDTMDLPIHIPVEFARVLGNANPNADALDPGAIYRLNIDNDGDYLTDIAFSYVFSKPQNGKQAVNATIVVQMESQLSPVTELPPVATSFLASRARNDILKPWLDAPIAL